MRVCNGSLFIHWEVLIESGVLSVLLVRVGKCECVLLCVVVSEREGIVPRIRSFG